MRWFLYIFSWYFFWLGVNKFLPNYVPLKETYFLVHIACYFMFFAFALARLLVWSKAKVAELPNSFNGLPYTLSTIGFWLVMLAFGGTIILGVMGGGISGVPAGLALIICSLLCSTSILATEIIGWLSVARAKP